MKLTSCPTPTQSTPQCQPTAHLKKRNQPSSRREARWQGTLRSKQYRAWGLQPNIKSQTRCKSSITTLWASITQGCSSLASKAWLKMANLFKASSNSSQSPTRTWTPYPPPSTSSYQTRIQSSTTRILGKWSQEEQPLQTRCRTPSQWSHQWQ